MKEMIDTGIEAEWERVSHKGNNSPLQTTFKMNNTVLFSVRGREHSKPCGMPLPLQEAGLDLSNGLLLLGGCPRLQTGTSFFFQLPIRSFSLFSPCPDRGRGLPQEEVSQ